MKHYILIVFMSLFLFVLSASLMIAGQPVNLEVAKRAAEYHGELLFKKDLKVCDYEILHWAWGEPAVYVFTLMSEGDFYPPNILLDNALLQGACLVSAGQEEAGYLMMAQAERYTTVYVGATTDMPSFIKAHAGLPEHIVTQPLMRDAPRDPYWIYGDPFHILLTSKSRLDAGDTRATEIHLKETVGLNELESEKIGAVPAYAEQIEWGRFTNPGAIPPNEDDPSLANAKGALEGWHQLTVDESNLKGEKRGCSPAAFYNCLKYLEKRKKVSTYGKDASFLLDWISICMRTDPANWGTDDPWHVDGPIAVFRGLGYFSTVTQVTRTVRKPAGFLADFADEINNRYPCSLGGTGKGIFVKHSTTGIGYWKTGSRIRLILHDGWPETPKPVTVYYSGYPDAKLAYPECMERFHPGARGTFPVAKPKLEAPDSVFLNGAASCWQWTDKLTTTPNDIKAQAYGHKYIFRDVKGVQYGIISIPRDYPFFTKQPQKYQMPRFKAGTVEEKYFLIDTNGHLLVAQKTIRLVDGIGACYTGAFSGTFTGYYIAIPEIHWKMTVSTTVTITVSGSGTSSDPYQGDFSIKGSDVEILTMEGEVEEEIYKNGLVGVGIVSGSAGQIVVAPSVGDIIRLSELALGPHFTVSFKGKRSAGDALTGTITFDQAMPQMNHTDAPLVKTIILTKSQ